MLQGESIFYPIFSQLFPFDIRYISDAVLPLTYNSTHLCTNVPQQEGQQGLFLCLSYHVPVKEMPHLAQILQTHTMTPPTSSYHEKLTLLRCYVARSNRLTVCCPLTQSLHLWKGADAAEMTTDQGV